MTVADLDAFLLVGGLVLVGAVLSVRLTIGVGLPALVVYLLIGVGMGESGLGIQFEDADLARSVSFAALVVILAEGGLSTRWRDVRPVLPVGISLATVGVAVTVVLMAVTARVLFDFDWTLALLLGAVFAPTDAAAVFSTLRRVPLKNRVASALESESGLNDAPTVVLVVLLSMSGSLDHGVVGLVGTVVYELLAGAVLGALVGAAGVLLLRRVALPASGLYPLFVMTFAVLGYAVPATVHASGFVGVYVASVMLGNSDLPHRVATKSFAEGLAWLAQIGLFVMLGLLSSPGRLGPSVVTAIVAGLVLTFVARPVSVLAATAPFRLRWGERAFLSWAGLRGAIPVVLATIPLSEDVPGATRLFDVVFVFVLVFTLLQAPPLPWLADRSVSPRGRSRATSRWRWRHSNAWAPTSYRCVLLRSRACMAWRSGSCACRQGRRYRSSCAVTRVCAQPVDDAEARRRAVSGHAPDVAGADRGAAARGQPPRAARDVAARAGWLRGAGLISTPQVA